MNRKQLTLLLLAGLAIGYVGLRLARQHDAAYRSTDKAQVEKLLGQFNLNDVAQVAIKSTAGELTLVKQDALWQVKERAGYPADFASISEFVRKAAELKAARTVKAGPSQYARLELLAPDQGAGSGTLVEFKDAGGKVLKSLLVGKKYLQEATAAPDPSGFGGGGGYPIGRFVMVPGNAQSVALVSDVLSNVEPKPEAWLNKDFFKVEKLRSVAVSGATNQWKVARETEAGPLALTDKRDGEDVDAGKLSSVGYALSSPSFNDVRASAKTDASGTDQPLVATLTTFDNFTYTLKIGAKTNAEDYSITVAVAAELATERAPGKDEKPEDKEKLDKEFKDKTEKLREKLKKEQALEKWTYVVSKWTIDPLLKERKDFYADKKTDAKAPAGGVEELKPDLLNLTPPEPKDDSK